MLRVCKYKETKKDWRDSDIARSLARGRKESRNFRHCCCCYKFACASHQLSLTSRILEHSSVCEFACAYFELSWISVLWLGVLQGCMFVPMCSSDLNLCICFTYPVLFNCMLIKGHDQDYFICWNLYHNIRKSEYQWNNQAMTG